MDPGAETGSGLGVPRWLKLASELAWRFLIVAAALVVLVLVFARLRLVVLPVLLALVLCTFLHPMASRLGRMGVPRTLAAVLVVAGAIAVLSGVAVLLAPPVVDEFKRLDVEVQAGLNEIETWLVDGPLDLSQDAVDSVVDRGLDELRERSGDIAQGVFAGALLLAEVLIGLLLTVVLLFFFLRDGERIWGWVVDLFDERLRRDVNEMGRRAWGTLGGYLRGVTLVALFDAVFIGLSLLLLGVPLVLPLAVLTFFGAYIPIVGAVVAGAAAALVALVSEGVLTALFVVAAVTVVQQLESNFFQPVVVGRAVKLHPVAVLLAVTAGGVLAGLLGALLATPAVAVANAMLSYARSRPPRAIAIGDGARVEKAAAD